MVHVLRVFVGPDGEHGNPLGVVLDGPSVPEDERQLIATALGFSETVFVDDPDRGELRIFTPAVELPFAGHPLVGTPGSSGRSGRCHPSCARPPARSRSAAMVSSSGSPGAASGRRRPSRWRWSRPRPIEPLSSSPVGHDAYCWAWVDEGAGTVRTRGFFPEEGIVEDEATGSAALALCVALGRDIEVRQGAGSLIHARHLGDGRAEVGGRVVLDEVRDLP